MTSIDPSSSSSSASSWSSVGSDASQSSESLQQSHSHDSSDVDSNPPAAEHLPLAMEVEQPESTGLSSSDRQMQAGAQSLSRTWNGFKLVGDNVDKNVRHTYQRLGQETISLHNFHRFAVLDRVDFGQLSNARRRVDDLDIDDLQVILTAEDLKTLEAEFAVLVSRYVVGP